MGINISINVKVQDMPKPMTVNKLDKIINVAIKSQMQTNVESKVPFDTGATYTSSVASYKKVDEYIIYETDYASLIYNAESFNFHRAKHKNAQARWHDSDWSENRTGYEMIVSKAIEEEWF